MSIVQLASRAARKAAKRAARVARSEFSRTPLGSVVSSVRKIRRDSKKYNKTLDKIEAMVLGGQTEKIRAAGGVEKYAVDATVTETLDDLFKTLGPMGDVLRVLFEGTKSQTKLNSQIDAAVQFLEAFGQGDRIAEDVERTIETAQEIEAAGSGTGTGPRVVYDPPTEAEEGVFGREIQVSSSNVFSFSFRHESRTRGILYVTFLAWAPGRSGRSGRGPLYAYYDVPVTKYQQFKSAASSSAGSAVWDYLRVRGSSSGHQHQYNLLQGAVMPGVVPGGVYIPRKATPRGFRRRAVPNVGTGKRGFTRSTLPERLFRGAPDRGTPNRGTPNRGTPNRG